MSEVVAVIAEGTKRCSCCREIKPLGDFYVLRSKNSHQSNCKACCKRNTDAWRKGHPEQRLAYARTWRERNGNRYRFLTINNNLKKKFGIDIEQYLAMLKRQDGGCAICGKTEPDGRRLSVDHDHKTGRIRALLCGRCNNGLGCYNDDRDLMRKAIAYLESHD